MAISTGQLAMRRYRLLDTHECNAYCRKGKHASVWYLFNTPDDEAWPTVDTVFRNSGLKLHHMEIAKEDDGKYMSKESYLPDGKTTILAAHPDDVAVGWLCIWEVADAATPDAATAREG